MAKLMGDTHGGHEVTLVYKQNDDYLFPRLDDLQLTDRDLDDIEKIAGVRPVLYHNKILVFDNVLLPAQIDAVRDALLSHVDTAET